MPEIEWETFLTSATEGPAGAGMVIETGSGGFVLADTGAGSAEERDIDLRFAFFNKSWGFL
jgi:hypothetical protein